MECCFLYCSRHKAEVRLWKAKRSQTSGECAALEGPTSVPSPTVDTMWIFWLLFCSCDENHDPKQLRGGKGLSYLTLPGHNPSLGEVRVGTWAEIEPETMKKAPYWIPTGTSQWYQFSFTTQDHLPREWYHPYGLDPCTSINNQYNPPQTSYRPIRSGQFLNWDSLFSGNSRMYLGDNKN